MRVRVYRLYNYRKCRYGEPFSMCDEHVKTYDPPAIIQGLNGMVKLADRSRERCILCEESQSAQ